MQQQLTTMTTMITTRRTTVAFAAASVAVGAGDARGVVDSGLWAATGFGVGAGTGTVGAGNGKAVGGSVGLGSGIAVGEGAGTAVGEGAGIAVGEGDGGALGAGDGDDVGAGLGAGVGENVSTWTESAVALAIALWRRRRPEAALWIADVKLPSLTAAPSTAITCEWTEWSPPLSAYVLAMNTSGMRTSLVTVMPVPSESSTQSAASNVELERISAHAWSYTV